MKRVELYVVDGPWFDVLLPIGVVLLLAIGVAALALRWHSSDIRRRVERITVTQNVPDDLAMSLVNSSAMPWLAFDDVVRFLDARFTESPCPICKSERDRAIDIRQRDVALICQDCAYTQLHSTAVVRRWLRENEVVATDSISTS